MCALWQLLFILMVIIGEPIYFRLLYSTYHSDILSKCEPVAQWTPEYPSYSELELRSCTKLLQAELRTELRFLM